MKWYQFIASYWSQIFAVLAAIGYIVKVVFEYRYKKKEVNYTNFAVQRTNAILKFYSDFNSLNYLLVTEVPELVFKRSRNIPYSLHNDIQKAHFSAIASYGQLKVFFTWDDLRLIIAAFQKSQTVFDNYLKYVSVKNNSISFINEIAEFEKKSQKLINEANSDLENFSKNWRETFQ